MTGRGRSIPDREKPLGLLDLWRARRSFVYRFEKRRLRARQNALRRRIVPWLVEGVFVLSTVCMLLEFKYPSSAGCFWHRVIALVVGGGVALGLWPMASASGVAAFGRERRDGTLDALVMTPISPKEWVAVRLALFWARLRTLFLALMICIIGFMVAYHWIYMPRWNMFLSATWMAVVGFLYYYSILKLNACLGLCLGLRLRSPGLALTVALIAFGLLVGLEVLAHLNLVLAVTRRNFEWSLFLRAGWVRQYALVLTPICLLAVLHLPVAAWLVKQTARRFDAWATAD